MNSVTKVHLTQTFNIAATSIINIYIPAYLLTVGLSLPKVIEFFILVHLAGLFYCFFSLVPLAKKIGILHTFRIAFPLQILSLLMLFLIKSFHILPEAVALIYGFANVTYWIPMNIFLITFSEKETMGENIAKFLALPNLLSIAGPLVGAFLVPYIGFWLVFLITAVGILLSFVPLAKIPHEDIVIETTILSAVKRIKQTKLLFLFEFLENILEESNWFWGVYVFLLLRSLSVPGIVGTLSAIGGSLFTLLVGKVANTYAHKLVPVATFLMLVIWIGYSIVHTALSAYMITLLASFALSFFMVTYYQRVYVRVKRDNEEEFMLAREIPVVGARMVVFIAILFAVGHLQFFFLLPLFVTLIIFFPFSVEREENIY